MQFRLWGAVGVMVLILAALFYTDLKAYERGYNKKTIEVNNQNNKAIEEAQNEILVIEDKYKKLRQKIRNAEAENNCVGDYVAHALDGL